MNFTIKVVYVEEEKAYGLVLIDNETGKYLNQWELDHWIKFIGGIEK